MPYTVDDLVPSSADGRELFDRACKYVARFLVEHFDSLKDLQKLLPHHTATGRTHKSVVVLMRILERDEKYTDETIAIKIQVFTCASPVRPQSFW